MREALAEALSDFDGAIVMVSHDRHLIGLVCDTFWRVADGVVEPFAGDLDQYAAWLRTRPAARGVRAKTEEVNQSQASLTAKSPASQLPVKKSVNSPKAIGCGKACERIGDALGRIGSQACRSGQLCQWRSDEASWR